MMDDTLVCCECGNENITLIVVFKEGDDNRNYDFCCHKCNTMGHIEDMVTWEQYKPMRMENEATGRFYGAGKNNEVERTAVIKRGI